MTVFDPVHSVVNSKLILEADGTWPSFHDAEVHELRFWRGDIRPNDNCWIGPTIEVSLELTALVDPFIAVLRFHDCDDIDMHGFNHCNMISKLVFGLEERGFYADNKTPILPFIAVSFQYAFGLVLSFKCLKVEALERRDVKAERDEVGRIDWTGFRRNQG